MYYNQIEGTGFKIIHDDFKACIINHARVERLFTGARWLEGPAYLPAQQALIFSDIPNNRMMRYCEQDGHVGVFRSNSNNTNGNTVDHEGRLVSCEHLTRRVVRHEHDGSTTVIAAHFEGKRLNSPNDVIVSKDGAIYFTDPDFGILTDYEGDKQTREQDICRVYCVKNGEISVISDKFIKPNGLAFSPDEKHLYVVESAVPRNITCITDGNHEVLAAHEGLFDGIRVDLQGRIWAGTDYGVDCLDRNGNLIGKIEIPERVSNICFGGVKRNRLYMCGTTSLYAVYLAINA
jgi:gluconolactonase